MQGRVTLKKIYGIKLKKNRMKETMRRNKGVENKFKQNKRERNEMKVLAEIDISIKEAVESRVGGGGGEEG